MDTKERAPAHVSANTTMASTHGSINNSIEETTISLCPHPKDDGSQEGGTSITRESFEGDKAKNAVRIEATEPDLEEDAVRARSMLSHEFVATRSGGEDAAQIIRLWRAKRMGLRRNSSNPFAGTDAVGWLSTMPKLDSHELRTTFKHIVERRHIGFLDVLGEDAHILTLAENSSDKKGINLDEVETFFINHGVPDFHVEGLLLALDELFTNAVYNAPSKERGNSAIGHASRKLRALSEKPVIIRAGVSNQTAAISVCDFYGTLKSARLMDVLRRCFEPGGTELEEKEGGAGLGFFFLVQQATRLVVNVKEGQFTEMVLTRDYKQRRRAFMNSSPTLNLCFIDGAEAEETARKHLRIPLKLPVRLVFEDGSYQGTALDVSVGGLFVATDDLHGFPNKFTVEIDLGEDNMFRQPAEVKWRGFSNLHFKRGAGIGFDTPLNENVFVEVILAFSPDQPASSRDLEP